MPRVLLTANRHLLVISTLKPKLYVYPIGHFLRSLRSGEQHFLRSLRSPENDDEEVVSPVRNVRSTGQHFLRSLRKYYEDSDIADNDMEDVDQDLDEYLGMDKRGGEGHFLRSLRGGEGHFLRSLRGGQGHFLRSLRGAGEAAHFLRSLREGKASHFLRSLRQAGEASHFLRSLRENGAILAAMGGAANGADDEKKRANAHFLRTL